MITTAVLLGYPVAQRGHELFHVVTPQPRRRLVEQQERWRRDDGPADLDDLLQAERERVGAAGLDPSDRETLQHLAEGARLARVPAFGKMPSRTWVSIAVRPSMPVNTLSSTLRSPISLGVWNVRPTPRRATAEGARPVTSAPAMRTVPAEERT